MIAIDKQFINYCTKNQNFIRKNFPISCGSIIKYKKTGIIDIFQPNTISKSIDFDQIRNDCYILPSLGELVDYCRNFFGVYIIKNKNGKCFASLGKYDARFEGNSEEEALLKAVIYFKCKD